MDIHTATITEQHAPSGARPEVTISTGWAATCSCGWTGRAWSVPSRVGPSASIAMAHMDRNEHVAGAAT